MAIVAIQHVRRMRGGAQGHLMRCSDGHFYVVKFRNNPQHVRILANEFMATRLAQHAGLPVPETGIVEVGDWLVRHTPALNIELAGRTIPCEPGLHFGSRYVVHPAEGQIAENLQPDLFDKVRNLETFAGMLVLDKWTCNADGRQAAFWRKLREKKYTVSFIDQGYCFNAGDWTYPDSPLRGVYPRNEVYENVSGWKSFDPWLSRIENMERDVIRTVAGEVPPDWYDDDLESLERLIGQLIERRKMVRGLISMFRTSPRRPFPRWRGET